MNGNEKMQTHKDYSIKLLSDKFESAPNSLFAIAKFIIQKDDLIAGFVFSIDLLTMFADFEIKEENLVNKAENIIKDYIDGGKIQHLKEYTFEYETTSFAAVKNPSWWIKSIRK